ncbi:ABC transporter permease subunit [Jiella sp. MQZ9-1]|uniref:ABC transporter permease subunit n=1 Tax=Jiella flava TaxID=2816857 RepID=A0A939FVY3_9HYPH|nr:ABC transporter permease subunit [Jiella flava]MBO0662445.1 ABC transporter permease subunit [Jiella flava]MCD2471670.1 ABC transporter permease subunit [Jiella flava]
MERAVIDTAAPVALGLSPTAVAGACRARLNWAWLGLVPFVGFTLLFLVAPVFYLFHGAFTNAAGQYTLENIVALTGAQIGAAYWLSIRLSFVSAAIGTVTGGLLAYALILGGMPAWVRKAFNSFSGVASNFAGVPLAFAFIATIGRLGLVTLLLRDAFGINLYASGFSLFSFWGLALTYLYFQLPLMVLMITPSMEGLRPEWREAAEILGASRGQYWRMVGLPVLAPSVIGCFLLLFTNAFGTLATVFALTGSNFSVVPIVLYNQIRGNVLYNPNLGYALALGMVLIMAFSNTLYFLVRSRAERWRK